MKGRSLTLVFLSICFNVISFIYVNAQDSIELPEIKGSSFQEYEELKIEITGIKRMQTYQPYWKKTGRVRAPKITAEPGFEIALVCIHTTRLGVNRGIKINHLYLYDSNSKKYEADLLSIFFLGTLSDSETDPKEHDYEFPVIVPSGIQISTVQLQKFTTNETRPFFVFQNLTFDLTEFNW